MANPWIDFKAVKAAIPLVPVLERYNVRLRKVNGTSFRSDCPLPSHQGKSAGTFSVDAEKNVFQCFSCKGKGNVLDFVAAMENVSVRDAALRLAEWFNVGNGNHSLDVQEMVGTTANPGEKQGPLNSRGPSGPGPVADAKPENKPLAFQLKGIQHDHPYLRNRGFEPALCEQMGVGFFPGKGSMAGRIVFPIHDEKGELVAYAGRLVDDALVSDEVPRWKLPKDFHKSLVLYNLHRVLAEDFDCVVVCESFWSVLAALRAGVLNAVATMGTELSPHQAELLGHFRHVVLMYDGDAPGRKASAQVGSKLLEMSFDSVKVVFLPADEWNQPDLVPAEELPALIG